MSRGPLDNDGVSSLLSWWHSDTERLRQEAVLSSLCISFAFTSGPDALGGSSASLPLDVLSESEELSESLVLPDSGLRQCADATLLGWDCRALQGHHELKLEGSMGEGYLLY